MKRRRNSVVFVAALCACCTGVPGPRNYGDSGTTGSDTDTDTGGEDGPTMTSMPGWELAFAVRAGGDEPSMDADLMYREVGCGLEFLDDGTIYVAGQVGEYAVFGEGTANETIFPNHAGWSDGFLARYSPEGVLEWVRRIGAEEEEHAYGVDAFADGTVILAGRYDSPDLVFGEGESNETTLTASHPMNAYVARYAPTGTLDWATSFPSTVDSLSYAASALALPDGRVLVGGVFLGTLWPGEPWEITSDLPGWYDGFLVWLGADGAVLAARRIGGGTDQATWGRKYVLSESGALFAALPYWGDELFGVGEEHETVLHCEGDPEDPEEECATALARYTTDGELEWVRSVNVARAGIAAIGDEAVGLAGYALDPESFLADTPIWTGVYDTRYIAVAKYGTADGQLEWARFAEMVYWFEPVELAVVGMPDGGLVALLDFQGSLSFDGSDTDATVFSAGEHDMALVDFAPDGEIRWVHRLGGTGKERPTEGIAQQGGTSLWLTGAYCSDPFVATSGHGDDVPLPLAGASDVFLLRFDSTSIPAE